MSSPYSQPDLPPLQPYMPDPPRKSGMGGGCFLIGCLGSLLVVGLLCGGSVWYVRTNFDRWIAGFAREIIVGVVKESEIPEQEKTEVIAQVDRVVTAYKDRKINQKDLERIMEELQDSPVFSLMMSYGLDKAYIDPSGLPEEEKQQARRTIRRAMRGVLDKKIKQQEFDAAMPDAVYDDAEDMPAEAADAATTDKPASDVAEDKPADDKPADDKPADDKPTDDKPTEDKPADEVPTEKADEAEPPPGAELTDKEVREFVARLKKLADDAQVPDEDFQIDIGDEIKQAVDDALQGTGVN